MPEKKDSAKKDEGSEQVAYDWVTGQDTPGVAGDDSHRSYENDQPQEGVMPAAEYGVVEQRSEDLGDVDMAKKKIADATSDKESE